ncbi:proline dehydrogenase family protein [Solirubrobacter sp. CPCC 204708]|uniref:Proline dehydrogenase family protein n=1 Tax=Solirubrobacter deserti TaxID=2282478 RepID=A0ABT4RCD5_9ACTN|nr:proline dehydrogenase family protein [Solirubrobacter deserti]MBE2315545.1 proline dehydrogenase family protein [Solirubrobacter deserti]MDA0136183.1 proline dehydrogenase family protein [Solirubrobacter deserti]
MAAPTQERPLDLERPIREIGTDLAARMPRPRAVSTARVERRMTELLMKDPALRAALFRFVDVRPACSSPADVTRHLHEFLVDAESKTARRATGITGRPLAQRPIAVAAAAGVKRMAQQFIIGEDARDALPEITKLWRNGVETTVDLLGEATVSETEADTYMRRCEETLRALASAATKPGQVNLSVKVSALTPLLRPTAPERGIEGARPRLERLLRVAKEVGAHLHVDMESFDTREAITALTLDLLSKPEFADGPSAGIVLQAYLVDSPEHLDELLHWAQSTPRTHPFVIRLVKGAYWDHEVVQAAQMGWAPPVFTDRHECDRNFEALTKRLIDATPTVKVAIASHNLRSISHAAAYADARGVGNEDLEFQILRGLGDDTQAAIAATGRQVRAYCPVGDLVAGMAYLVRRLLENTANDSFLAAAASGTDTAELLEAP